MLSVQYINENKEQVVQALKVKNFEAQSIINEIVSIDQYRRDTQKNLDASKSQMNTISKEIGNLFKEGKKEDAEVAKRKTSELKDDIKALESKLREVEVHLNKLLTEVPNVPHPSVPPGKSEADNQFEREGGEPVKLNGKPLPHWELAEKYDIIDFKLGNKITGAGFPVYKGKGARMQRALINFFLDEAQKAGFNEVLPPLMVNEDSGFGTGQLPDKEGQMYHVTEDNLYLIPTAEVPVTNIFRDCIVNEADFPIKYTAYTPCFRREAGSYGKDVRGLNRLHQFDKVEIVCVEHPDRSYQLLDKMVEYVESLIQKLGLQYRVLRLCGGDLSFTSALTFDFEVYSAAQEKWLEVSSVSNFESYQANRMKLRFKPTGEKKTQIAHTLNGSALALPRILAALLENYQTPEGIKVPEVLQNYTGFDMIN
ncbi:MAG: serine--tRNA ligase [Salinivirgaceae bacterium]|jgi:seryl-tRNA synthetase|nr:serine--tRNA ligase [Salinivirgaceae bacterium]